MRQVWSRSSEPRGWPLWMKQERRLYPAASGARAFRTGRGRNPPGNTGHTNPRLRLPLFQMKTMSALLSPPHARPNLPIPTRPRWQPLRLGVVELFHYDSEEFWFREGHLLLRGNNGTGKSKVLSLTLPLLLDAQLKPSRIEPDGDSGKKMIWNLLMNSHDRRNGY